MYNILQHYQVTKDDSEITKKQFWMIQSAKKGFSAHYLGFNLLDRLDIAYIIEVTSGLTSCDIFARFITFGGGFFHLLEMLT